MILICSLYPPNFNALELFIQAKLLVRDFSGGPVIKNPPYNAGEAGSIPGRGTKIPHAAGQLSLRATTTEHTCLN